MSHEKSLSIAVLSTAALCSRAKTDDRGVNTVVGAATGALIGKNVDGPSGAAYRK